MCSKQIGRDYSFSDRLITFNTKIIQILRKELFLWKFGLPKSVENRVTYCIKQESFGKKSRMGCTSYRLEVWKDPKCCWFNYLFPVYSIGSRFSLQNWTCRRPGSNLPPPYTACGHLQMLQYWIDALLPTAFWKWWNYQW